RVADSGERRFEVALDVVGKRLERRHVDDVGLVRKPAFDPRANERVDRAEERRQRLARAGGGGDEGVPARLCRRPCRDLRRQTPTGICSGLRDVSARGIRRSLLELSPRQWGCARTARRRFGSDYAGSRLRVATLVTGHSTVTPCQKAT